MTARADNAAATKRQAVQYVGESVDDFEQDVEMIKLDSFFPPGTKAQNLKIDVQGNELYVLRGAERLLKENKGRLRVRFENATSGKALPPKSELCRERSLDTVLKGIKGNCVSFW